MDMWTNTDSVEREQHVCVINQYYKMFRDKYHTNKKDFFNSPDNPDHSDQDSETDG